MATWPAYAKIKHDSLGEEYESALLRSDMESGPPKQTKIKSRVMVAHALVVMFATQADYASFKTWWQTDLNMGANWFDYPDPISETTKEARIVNGKLGRAEPTDVVGMWTMPLTIEFWSA